MLTKDNPGRRSLVLFFVQTAGQGDEILCGADIYNMNIYFKVVEVQIQALEYIPKLGRDTSHPGAVLEEPHPKDQGIENEWYHGSPERRRGLVEFFFVVGLRLIAFAEGGVEPELRSPERFPSRVLVWGSLSCVASDVAVGMGSK